MSEKRKVVVVRKRKARWQEESTEDLWAIKEDKNPPKQATSERLVFSLSKDQVPEGFTSSVIETTDSTGQKVIKAKTKQPPPSTAQTQTRKTKTKSKSGSLPSRDTPAKKSKPKSERKPPAPKKPTSVLDKLRKSAQDKPARVASSSFGLARPSRPIQVSNAFNVKNEEETFDARAEERAKEIIRQNALRAARQKEKMRKERAVETLPAKAGPSKLPAKPTQAKQRIKTSNRQEPVERKRERERVKADLSKPARVSKSHRIPSTNSERRQKKPVSLSPPSRRLSGSKRGREDRFSEPKPKRRKREPIYEEESDEELSDFIASDDDDRWSSRYSSYQSREYYSDDSPPMEASFFDVEEEERYSEIYAKKLERRELEKEKQRRLAKQKRLAQYGR